jgi:hypothetical protein
MDKVPSALTPSLNTQGGIFGPSTGALLSPNEVTQFQRNNGGMIHMLPVRYDIDMEVRHLCSKNQSPTTGDRAKQIQLMRYLKAFPSLGPVFSGDPASYKRGITLEGAADSSHAVHAADGRSHSAYSLTIGTCNAPFMVYSRAENSCISLSPHESEYVTLSRCARSALYFRQFAAELGFSQAEPTRLQEDSRTAINLTIAPAISRLSRHIAQKHHFLRWLYKQGSILPVAVGTHDINPNGMTKTLGPTDFLYFRHHLFHPFKA